jgi:hypothetical protein
MERKEVAWEGGLRLKVTSTEGPGKTAKNLSRNLSRLKHLLGAVCKAVII